MNLNLYDENLNRIAIIENRFVSVLWSEGYNTMQSFTLEVQATDEYKDKFKPDRYVGRSDRDTLMVIKTVEVNGNTLVASGKQATRVLDDVAFIGTIESGGLIDKSVVSAYNGSSKFPLLEFENTNLGIKYGHQISHKSFRELCETMAQDTDVGFRVIKRDKTMIAEFYKPEINPNLVFSEKYGNLTLHKVNLSTENLKNYAIVLGEGQGEQRVRVDVDLSNGEQRRELIIDARGESQEEAETLDQYKQRLRNKGIEKLMEQRKTWSCEFTPISDDFGKRYDLGDMLTVLLPEFGLKIRARVAKFTQKEQRNKTDTTVEVGDITILR